MEVILASGLAGALHAPRTPGTALVSIGSDHAGYGKVGLDDVDRYELLLHKFIANMEVQVNRQTLCCGFRALDSNHGGRLSGGHGVQADFWAQQEALKTAMLYQYVLRFMRRPNFSRSVAINRLKSVWGYLHGEGARKPAR